MTVKFADMMKELFTPKERATIRRSARSIAKQHIALRELRRPPVRTQGAMARRPKKKTAGRRSAS